MVGSVIVANGKIIGEGWHKKAGEPHAEVHAINSVKDKSQLKDATIYVSLEPCSHFGKTPPCADLIVRSEIPRVVIGTVDPNHQVAGKGIERLKNAGIEVTVGVLEKECQELNKRFFTFHNQKRPYIILKWAESQDAFIAPSPKPNHERAPIWITNPYSRQLVHKWRSEEQAILVGTQTVLADNPKLDTRDWQGQHPTRILIDQKGRIPEESYVLDQSVPTLIFTSKKDNKNKENCTFEIIDFNQNIVPQLLQRVVVFGHLFAEAHAGELLQAPAQFGVAEEVGKVAHIVEHLLAERLLSGGIIQAGRHEIAGHRILGLGGGKPGFGGGINRAQALPVHVAVR